MGSEQAIYPRAGAGLAKSQSFSEAWSEVLEELAFYAYIFNNLARRA